MITQAIECSLIHNQYNHNFIQSYLCHQYRCQVSSFKRHAIQSILISISHKIVPFSSNCILSIKNLSILKKNTICAQMPILLNDLKKSLQISSSSRGISEYVTFDMFFFFSYIYKTHIRNQGQNHLKCSCVIVIFFFFFQCCLCASLKKYKIQYKSPISRLFLLFKKHSNSHLHSFASCEKCVLA